MYERRKDYVSEALDGEEHAGPSFERRVQYLIPFLATWFANAPKPEHLSESIVELDRAALGIIDGAAFRSKGWMQWRSNEEEAMSSRGSPEFRRALSCLRTNSTLGFTTIDERIWFASDGPATTLQLPALPTSKCAGTNGEPYRSHTGPFHEVGPYTIPPDPTRLVSSDLALFAAGSSQAKALLVSKIADASLMVRFGSMPRPAKRRPRILFVASLEDDLSHHVLRKGSAVPAIDSLREILIHAIPACLRNFAALDADVEVEVRRKGPLSRGLITFNDIRNKRHTLRLELKRVPEFVQHMSEKAPWFIDDSFTAHREPRPCSLAAFDAGYLLTVGAESKLQTAVAWTAVVLLKEDRAGTREVVPGGAASAPPLSPDPNAASDVWGAYMATCFGTERASRSAGLQQSATAKEGRFA